MNSPGASRAFCVRFGAITGLTLVGLAAVNFWVDPYGQYGTRLLSPLVQTPRLQKVQFLKQMQSPPEALVLGSSRVLKLEPDYLQQTIGYRFFNAGVNQAKPEDILAFFRYFQTRFATVPRMLIVGLDVNAFNSADPPDARLLATPELVNEIPEAIRFSDRLQRWQELISWQQTKMSFRSICLQVGAAEPLEPLESFRKDGVIVYHQREKQLSEGTYDFQAALEYNKKEYRHLFRVFERLSPMRCRTFDALVEECRSGRCQLVVFLTPLHPELSRYLSAHTDYQERKSEVLTYLQKFAESRDLTLVDLSEISSFSADPSQFVDGIHPLELNTRRMIDRIVLTLTTQDYPDLDQPRKPHYVVQ